MILRLATAFLCSLALGSAAAACLNMYGTDVHGHPRDMDMPASYLANDLRRVELNLTEWAEHEARLAPGLESAGFKDRADYAVALIYLGRYDEAIEILEQIEIEQPGEYIVATNLGTAYELNGELEKALEWIQIGFERNPEAHDGSEWLHVKILEARIQLAQDPAWLQTHSVLGVDFGSENAPVSPPAAFVDSQGRAYNLYELAAAIEYQLRERLQFVPPQDPVVGDLLFDLGNLTALTSTVEEALPLYDFAEEYGVQDPVLLVRRVAYFESLSAANPELQSFPSLRLSSLVAVAAALFALLVFVPVAYVVYRRMARGKAV